MMDISAKNKRVVDVDGKTFDTQREAFIHIMQKTFVGFHYAGFSEIWKHRRAIGEVISDFDQHKFSNSYDAPPTGDEEPAPKTQEIE